MTVVPCQLVDEFWHQHIHLHRGVSCLNSCIACLAQFGGRQDASLNRVEPENCFVARLLERSWASL
jgi:hypothetical protein